MAENINILLQNMGASQLSYFTIKNCNDFALERSEIDIIVFYENLHKNCLSPNFAVMQIAEAWGQKGPMVATSLSTAFKLISFPCGPKLFYIWDLEWLRGQQQYEKYADVYTHPALQLVARSESHKRIIENAFNRKVDHILDDFNLNHLLGII
jgi:hypothetical protein